jgi:AraC family transcriptional regulator of adaptative response/methylated-DNA-[protein]-cysteine methyltransferase
LTATPHTAWLAGEPIRYAIATSWLGHTLLAQSARGICALFMGDDPDALATDLQRRFPRAALLASDAECLQRMAPLLGSPDTVGMASALPLDLRGTAFQQRVWRALLEIQAGRTVSYSDIARRIDAPRAVRAVAQACGANPVAVVVPCHRVVAKDGALTGYRWGVQRKHALLEREAAQACLMPPR